jgi:hypothetical protein
MNYQLIQYGSLFNKAKLEYLTDIQMLGGLLHIKQLLANDATLINVFENLGARVASDNAIAGENKDALSKLHF